MAASDNDNKLEQLKKAIQKQIDSARSSMRKGKPRVTFAPDAFKKTFEKYGQLASYDPRLEEDINEGKITNVSQIPFRDPEAGLSPDHFDTVVQGVIDRVKNSKGKVQYEDGELFDLFKENNKEDDYYVGLERDINKEAIESAEHVGHVKEMKSVDSTYKPTGKMTREEKMWGRLGKTIEKLQGTKEQRDFRKDILGFMGGEEGKPGYLQEALTGLQQLKPSPLETQVSSVMQGLAGPLASDVLSSQAQPIPFASQIGREQGGLSDLLTTLGEGGLQLVPQLAQGLGGLLQGAGQYFGG